MAISTPRRSWRCVKCAKHTFASAPENWGLFQNEYADISSHIRRLSPVACQLSIDQTNDVLRSPLVYNYGCFSLPGLAGLGSAVSLLKITGDEARPNFAEGKQ